MDFKMIGLHNFLIQNRVQKRFQTFLLRMDR